MLGRSVCESLAVQSLLGRGFEVGIVCLLIFNRILANPQIRGGMPSSMF